MTDKAVVQPAWINRGKSIRQVIQELLSFEDQDLEVHVSVDGGDTSKPISLVVKKGKLCVLMYNG